MIETNSLKQPLSLKISSSIFVVLWCVIASFPILWITVMSVKLPIDAFSSNPLTVIFGPLTSYERNYLSFQDLLFCTFVLIIFIKFRAKFYNFFDKFINFNETINIIFFYIYINTARNLTA